MHKVVYLPLAEADILEAVDYIAFNLDAPSAAEDLLSEIDKTVKLIAEFPYPEVPENFPYRNNYFSSLLRIHHFLV